MKAFTCPSSTSRAQMMTRSAKVALPIQRFSPFMTQESPSRRAVVSSITESEPWSGSVRPQAPIFSILAIPGSHLRFCSSEPQMATVPTRHLDRHEPGCDLAHARTPVLLDGAPRYVQIGDLGY